MTLPGAGWSGDFYANQQALPNEHLPAAQSPEGRVLNTAGFPAGWQRYFAFLEER